MLKMLVTARACRLASFAVLLALAGCQSMFPGEEDPALALMRSAAAESGPSAQRLDAGGFPMLGAFPDAAASQLPDATVASERQRLQSAAAEQNAAATASTYQTSIQEMESIKQRQQAEAAAALAEPASGPAAGAASSSETVLKQIQGK